MRRVDSRIATQRQPMLLFGLTLVVVLVLASFSLGGLLVSSSFYPTKELRQSFLSNDAVNLFIGLPILLLSLTLARQANRVAVLAGGTVLHNL